MKPNVYIGALEHVLYDVPVPHLLLHIVVACGGEWLASVPELDAVSALGSLCKDILRQLYRLHPLVYRRVQIISRDMSGSICRLQGWRFELPYCGRTTMGTILFPL